VSDEPAVVPVLALPLAGFLSTALVGRGLRRRVASGARVFDERVIDETVNGVGRLGVGTGDRLRVVQTGRVHNYALGIAFGLIAMVGAYLVIAGR